MNEKSDHPQLLFHPLLLLPAAILVTLLLGWLEPLPFPRGMAVRVVGAILFVGGLLFGLPAFLGMRRAKTSPNPLRPSTKLVEGGTYRVTRNPMYLAMVVAYAGLFTFLQNAWFLPGVPLLVWLLSVWVVIPEEQYLRQKFGQEYQQFAARVPRWL